MYQPKANSAQYENTMVWEGEEVEPSSQFSQLCSLTVGLFPLPASLHPLTLTKADILLKCLLLTATDHWSLDIFKHRPHKSVFLCSYRIRMFTGDTSNDIHSPGPVIWQISP